MQSGGLMSEVIKAALANLQPSIPWAHHFNLHGVETITREYNEQFYNKAQAVKILGQLGLIYYKTFSQGLPLSEARVLDVASAEGGLSVEFAGAKEVIGIEGRQLYVNRANFVKDTLGLPNVRFVQGDVRKIDPGIGPFDFTICSGILHHLGSNDFFSFLLSMAALTAGTFFLYTHVSAPDAVTKFRLEGPVKADGFDGFHFREHADHATVKQREELVRASLDNTFSFWATEESLVAALKKAGFNFVCKMFEPHAFGGYANRNIRVIFICRKNA
jgi:2-polyprenyl-3-methyl-5-hydroxy-6-metoxy-1,4-benzoquinol methylase